MTKKIVDGVKVDMTADDIAQRNADLSSPAEVPQSVSMRQARLALLNDGILGDVDIALASLPEPDKSEATIEWEYSQTVERNRPFVALLGAALGLNDTQLDDLFILAATL